MLCRSKVFIRNVFMVVLPDLTEQVEAARCLGARKLRDKVSGVDWPLTRSVAMMFLSLTLFFSAAGLWFHPTPGYAVMVIKLAASVLMFGFGVVLLSDLNAKRELACVEIDLRRTEIRTFERDISGQVYLTGRHDLHAMTEICLNNRTLFARDAGGRMVVSVPLRNRKQEQVLREALSLT